MEYQKCLLSDQGKDLISNVVKHLCKLLGIKKLQTPSYWARGNGTVERWNEDLGKAFKAIALDRNLRFHRGDSWDIYVPMIAANHNDSFSRRIGMTRNKLNYGKDEITDRCKHGNGIKFK